MQQNTSASTIVMDDAERQQTSGMRTELWQRIALGAIIALSIFLNFFRLGHNQFADITTGVNSYYAAAVKSMAMNWHNFFFAAFDPQGFLAIDKPPLGFWLQVASVRIFGFNDWSLLLPQALAGVGAVIVLYILIQRVFGPNAGLIAALALAVTPISVVTSRNNTIDSVLILTLLFAAWALSIGAQEGSWRWLVLSALLVGLGFNIKMLEAYLVLPPFALVYLLSAPRRLRTRFLHLALAGIVLLLVSFSWIAVVDMVPEAQRPYVSSSQHDSELELALGYNGLSRAFGIGTGNNTQGPGTGGANPTVNTSTLLIVFGIANTGRPGPLRLVNPLLGGQIGWLLLFALMGLIAVWRWRWLRQSWTPYRQGVLLWSTWFLTLLLFFSFALFDHPYYMVTFAPAICALVGIGSVEMYRAYCGETGWQSWLLPGALCASALVQAVILAAFPQWNHILAPVIIGLSLLIAVLLTVARFRPRFPRIALTGPLVSVAVLILLLTPAIWSMVPLWSGTDTINPLGGPPQPVSLLTIIAHAFIPESEYVRPDLTRYLLEHQGQDRYLVATVNASTAAPFILDTGKAAIALGGFNGFDQTISVEQAAELVQRGEVRFFLLPMIALPTPQNVSPRTLQALKDLLQGQSLNDVMMQPAISQWVHSHCAVIARDVAEPGTPGANDTVSLGAGYILPEQLFDCAHG